MKSMNRVSGILVVTFLFASTIGATAHADPAKTYQYKYISGEQSCADFKELRSANERLKKANATGQLNLAPGDDTIEGISGITVGVVMVAREVFFFARTKVWRPVANLLPLGAGMIVGGVSMVLFDDNQKQIDKVDDLLKNPSALLAKSDQEACSYLFEYPAMRSKIAEDRDAALWVIENRYTLAPRDGTILDGSQLKSVVAPSSAPATAVLAGSKTAVH